MHDRQSRTGPGEEIGDTRLEQVEIAKFNCFDIACRACHPGKIKLAGTRGRMGAVHFIHPVHKHEMMQIGGCRIGNTHQRTEVHQQAAIAVEHQHFALRVG